MGPIRHPRSIRTSWIRRPVAALGLAATAGAAAALAGSLGPDTVTPWAPAGISSPAFESHAAIDPRTGDIWFVRSTKAFTGWRILVARCAGRRLSGSVESPFAGGGVEADPAFSADGSHLLFISTRATGTQLGKDLDIWRADRGDGEAWHAAERLPAPVNSDHAEWFPREAPDGWLYFGSDRPGGHGGNDIWRARRAADGTWVVENAGPNVNSEKDEYEPLPSPDGRRLLIEAGDGYYVSERRDGAWAPRVRLGPEVNANGSEVGALFSPSGRSLLFARDTGGPASGEFLVWRTGEPEDWPRTCGDTSGKR